MKVEEQTFCCVCAEEKPSSVRISVPPKIIFILINVVLETGTNCSGFIGGGELPVNIVQFDSESGL